MTSDRITITDLTDLFCVAGIRKAFAREGVDLEKFIEEGATESELRGHGFDAMLNRVIERKAKNRVA